MSAERLPADAPGGVASWRIRVADNGVGFDEQYLDRIFAPFQRLHGRGKYEGSGIGLPLCRRICERHFGSITTKSEPNAGTEFEITLPTRQPLKR